MTECKRQAWLPQRHPVVPDDLTAEMLDMVYLHSPACPGDVVRALVDRIRQLERTAR